MVTKKPVGDEDTQGTRREAPAENSFSSPALLHGRITKTEANLDWQSKAPTHNSQISTSRDTVKKMVCKEKSVLVVIVVHDWRRLLRRRTVCCLGSGGACLSRQSRRRQVRNAWKGTLCSLLATKKRARIHSSALGQIHARRGRKALHRETTLTRSSGCPGK